MSAGRRSERLEGPWSEAASLFVAFKRSVGYDYAGTQVGALARLCRFLDGREMDESAFAEWAAERPGEACTTRGKRVLLWNDFARFVLRGGGEAAVVDLDIPSDTGFVPHIYTDDEVARILRAADAGVSTRASAYDSDAMLPVLVRLLYSTGLRFGEAARLAWGDVDGRRLEVRRGKNGRPRLVVLSGSMAAVMEAYRDGRRPVGPGDLVFCGSHGGGLQNQLANKWHHRALDAAGVRSASGGYPRLHDYRHTFAVRALARMDAAGADVRVALPLLSRYLGHCGPKETEYYLRLTEEGRASVLGRMASYAPGVVPDIGGGPDG